MYLGLRACTSKVLVDLFDPNRIYAGSMDDGMFRSNDGGQTWKEINRGIKYKSIWAIAQHPKTGRVWAGTEPASMFKSDDQGETWTDCPKLRDMEPLDLPARAALRPYQEHRPA